MRRLHGLVLFTALLALSAPSAAAPRMASGDLVKVRPSQMRPSQMYVGQMESNERHVDVWRADAAKRGISLKKYAKTVLKKEYAKQRIQADVAPDGSVMPGDAHHRIRALQRVAELTGYQVKVRVEIDKNYKGWKLEDFAKDYVEKRGKGYFPPSFDKLTPVERLQRLPTTFVALKNSPMRSAMGSVYRKLEIEDVRFENYAEFKVGAWLVKHGLMKNLAKDGLVRPGTRTLTDALVRDDRVISVMEKTLRSDAGHAFLVHIAATNQREKLEKRLSASLD
ncbi:MAG: ParB-like protein [Polyangia bacterium]